jgi:hypothetical protein
MSSAQRVSENGESYQRSESGGEKAAKAQWHLAKIMAKTAIENGVSAI